MGGFVGKGETSSCTMRCEGDAGEQLCGEEEEDEVKELLDLGSPPMGIVRFALLPDPACKHRSVTARDRNITRAESRSSCLLSCGTSSPFPRPPVVPF
jgi:hypothetical protein